MKRVKNRGFLFFCSFFFLLDSCGLDTLVYLEPPHYTRHADSEQEAEQYIEFRTSDTANASTYCKGFQIFYKIYATTTDLQTDVAAINSYNNSSPYAAARYLLETKKYKAVRGSNEPLILHTAADRVVKVRLYDYSVPPDPNAEKAGLYLDGGKYSDVFRYNGAAFKKLSNTAEDDDIYKTSKTAADYEYVAFFAVTVGLDEHFSPLYSQLLDLGHLVLK